MADILNLLDTSIPLQKRYDTFLKWDNQNAFTVTNLVATKLEIGIAHVEVFFDLGKLDDEEFPIIDDKKISIDSLVLIVKEEKSTRLKVYSDYEKIVNTIQPIKALREYIDNLINPSIDHLYEKLTSGVFFSISKYLKQRGIDETPLNLWFRSFMVGCGKTVSKGENLSERQKAQITRAISYDNMSSLNVFSNDILKNDFEADFNVFQEITELINKTKG